MIVHVILTPGIRSHTSSLRITHAELRITYAELRRNMWNFCGTDAELCNALQNSAKVSQHAEIVPHPSSEYFPHLYGKIVENSDLVFLHSGTMRKISTLTIFAAENILEKFPLRKFRT